MENKLTTGKIIVIALKLLVICAFVALLVAAVNFLTFDKIVLNEKNDVANTLTQIYYADNLRFKVDEDGNYAMTDEADNIAGKLSDITPEAPLSDIDTVYQLTDNDEHTVGYCVMASPMGFSDEVSVIVAVNKDGTVKQVSVSQKDTPGKGDKVENAEHLANFAGYSTDDYVSSDHIIAGATRTSKPVANAVGTALEQVNMMLTEGAESNG